MGNTYGEKLIAFEKEKELPMGERLPDLVGQVPERAVVEKPQAATLAEAHAAVAEAEPVSGQTEALKQLEEAENKPQTVSPGAVSRELRKIALYREIKHLQRNLPAPQRALSRVIHQPIVRVTSEAAGKTISRPSGLLGGGLVAFLGTSGYLLMAKYLGFRYNYTLFVLLFFGGFVLGLALELLVHFATLSRRRSD